MKKVMVFAPHPDDDLIGCGGSMARHAALGNQVSVIYLTSGEAGSLKHPPAELGAIREQEATDAASQLGIDDLDFLRWPDGRLVFSPDNLQQLTSLIRSRRPHIVYLPHRQDHHQDHQIAHQLIYQACLRAAGPWFPESPGDPWSVGTILAYEVWSPLSEITYREDITDFMELKLQALKLHRSQVEQVAYPDAVCGLNRYRAVMGGAGSYCECFQVIKTESLNLYK